MENEKKDLQGGIQETELQEKMRRDVSEKIAEAAAEVQEEIAEAAENVEIMEEAAEDLQITEDEATSEALEASEEVMWEEVLEEIEPEPKKVTLKLSNLILSWIGTAVAGALILLLCLQIPGWIQNMPEGKTAVTVDGAEITDMDMRYYIYAAAMDYFEKNRGTVATATEYNWDTEVSDGKTAADLVKENALETAIGETLLMNAGRKSGMEWDEEEATTTAKNQVQQMISVYGEELVDLNSKAQGLGTIKQYTKKVVQAQLLNAVHEDMEANPDLYYPEDKTVLEPYARDDRATVKHILIKTEKPAEGEEAASTEEQRAKAEEILTRIKNGEDFDVLLKEFNQDTAEPDTGYTFGPGEMVPAFEETSFALKINEVSDVVETEHGYHIIKRLAGRNELEGYWKESAKIRIKERVLEKLSVADILTEIEQYAADFKTLYAETQGAGKTAG